MMPIKEAMGTVLVAPQPTKTTSISRKGEHKADTFPERIKKRATREQVAQAIMSVELAKQIKPLTREQRLQLLNDLLRHNFTPEELSKRAESVKLQDTFGTIAYEYWMKDLICSRAELEGTANYRANLIVAERRLRSLVPDAEEVGVAAVSALNQLYEQEFLKALNEAVDKKETEVALWQKKIRSMSPGQRARVLKLAVKRGVIPAFDPIIITHMDMKFIVLKLLPVLGGGHDTHRTQS